MNFSGVDTYIEDLQRAGGDIDAVSRVALAEVAEELQSALINNVPIVDGVNTVLIQEHINIRTPSGEGHYNYVNVGILHDIAYTPKGVNIHAKIVEFGSVWTPPRPFIRPIISAFKSHFLQIVKFHLSKAQLIDP